MMVIEGWGAEKHAVKVSLHLFILDLCTNVPILIAVVATSGYNVSGAIFFDVLWKACGFIRSSSYFMVYYVWLKTGKRKHEPVVAHDKQGQTSASASAPAPAPAPETPKGPKKEGDAMIDIMNKLNERPKKASSPSSRSSRKGIPFVPGTFYITFVPHNAEKQFEDYQKHHNVDYRKCTIQSKDHSGTVSSIIDSEQLNVAIANKASLELLPNA